LCANSLPDCAGLGLDGRVEALAAHPQAPHYSG
jgi:hypothetical protein